MRHFFPGEMYAAWTKAEELSYRIVELHDEDVEANDTKDKRRKRLHKRRTDLNTMLNIIGGKTDQYNFDDVLKIIQFSEAIYKFFCVVEEVDSCGFCGEDFLTVWGIFRSYGDSRLYLPSLCEIILKSVLVSCCRSNLRGQKMDETICIF